MDKNAKIYIAGSQGLANLSLQRVLEGQGYTNIITRTQAKLNLLNNTEVADFFNSEKPDYVFLTSYKSGSIQENINHPAEFIYENLVVQNNIIHNAYLGKVKKLLFIAASCVYPKNSSQPIKEEYLLTGDLEPTSESYAMAKIAGIKMCQAYNRQYGTKFISVVPATLYGLGDSFDSEKSHVLSALIRKFYEAKINGQKEVVLWGSGSPAREFIYGDDFADACIFIMDTECDFDAFDKLSMASTERFDRPERLTAEGLSRMSNPEPSRRIDTFDELSINLFEPEPILSESYDRRPQSRRPERSRRINLINIGTGTDITVKELAEKIKAVIGFQGEIKWDTSKPDGALKKLLDVSHLYLLGWLPKVKLEDGLKMTYNWFIEHCNK